jgi:hypothetical protein
MRIFSHLALAAVLAGLGGCPTGNTPSPAAPDQVQLSPEAIAGVWINESMGLTLTFDASGTFSWKQGEVLEQGNFSLMNGIVYLSVTEGKTTPYKVISLTAGQISLEDPRGAVAYLVRQPSDSQPGAQLQPAVAELPQPILNVQDMIGIWSGPYGIELALEADGTFAWMQPTYTMTGTYTVTGDVLNLEVQGNPTLYKILSLSKDAMVIVDPEKHEITLARKSISAASPTPAPTPGITIVEEPTEENITLPTDEKALFTVNVPAGWKVTRPSSCTFPCSEPFVLKDPAGRMISLTIDAFVTQAGPGAFNKLVPGIDAIMGGFPKNREKTVDPIDSMNNVEVFSRRFTGKTDDDKQGMVARIIGVHVQDFLILGVVLTSAQSKHLKSLKPVMETIIDTMNFSIAENAELRNSTVGTWLGQSKDASSVLSLQSKHLFLFYADGKFIHVLASDKFVADEASIKALIAGPSAETGSYKVIRESLMLLYDGPRAGGKDLVEGYALSYDGNYLFMDSLFLKKVILN